MVTLRREIRTLEEELVVLVEEMEAVAAAAAEAEAAKSPDFFIWNLDGKNQFSDGELIVVYRKWEEVGRLFI